jgi:hypothetical protein
MREIILEERRQRLERFITKVKTKVPPPHLRWRWAKELIQHYFAYLRAQNEGWPQARFELSLIVVRSQTNWIQLRVHDQYVEEIRKGVELLHADNKDAAIEHFEHLMSEEVGRELESRHQRVIGSNKHVLEPYKNLLREILRQEPSISDVKLLERLYTERGKGVVKSISRNNKTITLEQGKTIKGELVHRTVSLSGLNDMKRRIKATI